MLEAPDVEIDRIIRSIKDTGGISGKLAKEFPVLENSGLAQQVVEAVLGD